MRMHEFDPDWTLAPAALLEEWLEQGGMSAEDLAVAALARTGGRYQALPLIEAVLACEQLGDAHAAVLEAATAIPARLWLGWEAGYRDSLAKGRTDVTYQ